MSTASTDAFLAGQGIPVEPARIESELTLLWGPAAERVGGPELESPNVTRVVLANLIVQADDGCAGRVSRALDEVVARHPSRSIVLCPSDATGRGIGAEVAAICHLAAPGMPQVCSERIVLKAGPGGLDLLPGAVRPLLESDLPVVLWWTGDPRANEGLFRALARDATRVILDVPDPGAEVGSLRLGLDPSINPYARDSAWLGIDRWRELIAQFFDGPDGHASIDRIASVTIEATAPTDSACPRLAVWLAAWLAGQLGWEGLRRTSPAPGRIDATFRAGGREVAASIRTVAEPSSEAVGLRSATIELIGGDGPMSLRLARPKNHPDSLRVEACSDRACALPRVVSAPELDTARRISAGIESSRDDPPARRALPHLLWLLG